MNEYVAVLIDSGPYILATVFNGLAFTVGLSPFAFNRKGLAQLLHHGTRIACKGQVTVIYLSTDFLQLAVVHRIRVVRTIRHAGNLLAACVDTVFADYY